MNATLWPIRLARRLVSQLVLTTKRLVIRMWTIAHLITAAALQPFGAALRYSARAVRLAAEYSIKRRGKNRPILNDALGGEFGALLLSASANMLAVTKGAIYICMSSSELDTLQKAFREASIPANCLPRYRRWCWFRASPGLSFSLPR